MSLIQGRIISNAITLCAELGVADHMSAEPTPVATLAAKTGTTADGLYRLMRALSPFGVFVEAPDRAFALSPMSELLRSNVPGSVRPMARWQHESARYAAWGALEHAVKTGEPAFDKVHGMPVFEYFGKHPAVGKIFDEAMGGFTVATSHAVAKAYDFSEVQHVVDIGGSQGVLLSGILARYPKVRGTLFDLPHVIDGAKAVLARDPNAARIEAVAGNFLEGVPKGADAYIMKSIVHDWGDDHCIELLANCRAAMAPGGRVLIVEGVVIDAPESMFFKLLDLEMLVMTTGGRERTEAEFRALLKKAGLELARVVPTESPMSVLEARAAILTFVPDTPRRYAIRYARAHARIAKPSRRGVGPKRALALEHEGTTSRVRDRVRCKHPLRQRRGGSHGYQPDDLARRVDGTDDGALHRQHGPHDRRLGDRLHADDEDLAAARRDLGSRRRRLEAARRQGSRRRRRARAVEHELD